MSFRELTTFSMAATRERQHKERIPCIKKYQKRILPVSVIYGGNASGKTNFFKALNFVRKFVLEPPKPDGFIPVEPFRLHAPNVSEPSLFILELLIDETIYEFSFSVTRKNVVQEKLVSINSSSEKTLYVRKNNKIQFSEENNFLDYVFKGTRDNQLFLTNSISQNDDSYRAIYNWFYNLKLIAPDTRFGPFEQFLDKTSPLCDTINNVLSQFDTGISHLSGESIQFDNLPFPAFILNELQEKIKEGMSASIISDAKDRFLITRKNGELEAKKLVAVHTCDDGSSIQFDMRQESDGTLRIIDLLPAFLELLLKNSKNVYVIDEVDRSLHTLLTRKLLEMFLQGCGADSRSQLLITTHDVLLMDQGLLRRDEMWVTEKSKDCSELISFSEYKGVRYDKDIRKSYLQGRFGGIPKLF